MEGREGRGSWRIGGWVGVARVQGFYVAGRTIMWTRQVCMDGQRDVDPGLVA